MVACLISEKLNGGTPHVRKMKERVSEMPRQAWNQGAVARRSVLPVSYQAGNHQALGRAGLHLFKNDPERSLERH